MDRTLDHLSSSDAAIIHARQILLDALDDMAAGRTPRGAGPDLDLRRDSPQRCHTCAETRHTELKRNAAARLRILADARITVAGTGGGKRRRK